MTERKFKTITIIGEVSIAPSEQNPDCIDTLIELEDNSWEEALIPSNTLTKINIARQRGGQWRGEVTFKHLEHFHEGQSVYIRDILAKQSSGLISKN